MVSAPPALYVALCADLLSAGPPIERVCGDVHDKCTRHHKRKRLRDLMKDVEWSVQENGPWHYKLSQVYYASEITAAVENLAAEATSKAAA